MRRGADNFRERLLQGRRELIDQPPAAPGSRGIEIGGGTGRNLDFFGSRLNSFVSIEIFDLCQPLLDVAARPTLRLKNVRLTRADASTYRPDAAVGCVYFS